MDSAGRCKPLSHNNIDALVYEQMLLARTLPPRAAAKAQPDTPGQEEPLDRSATVLLARLIAQGPMTVTQLAKALDLDVSTVHRQVAAAMKRQLIDRFEDPYSREGRRHVASKKGRQKLLGEFEHRTAAVEAVVADWDYDDLAKFVELLRRFNQGMESQRGQLWPR